MGTYRPLYSLRVEHDYYDNLACRALAFRLKAGGVDLCRRRGLLFRQTAVNEWTLLYDCDSAGVDTSSDKVEAELCITDPAFVLFTDWAALRPENAYTLELPASRDTVEATEAIRESADRRRIGSGFCSVSILMTEKILAAAQKEKHKTCTLRFHAPQCKWEYLLVPRDGGSPDPRQCRMEEQGGTLAFTPFKTFKAYGLEVLRTVSQEAVPMKEHYAYKLKVFSSATGSGRRQVLLKYVPPPEPSKFLDAEPGLLRQVCYL